MAGSTAADADILCVDLVRIFQVRTSTGPGVEVQALQGLNLRVDPGELVAVVGASGSGKSTLLSILSSLDQPTAGVAWVAGHDLLTMGEKERVTFRRSSVGFVWQQTSRNLVPYFTAAENIAAALGRRRAGLGGVAGHDGVTRGGKERVPFRRRSVGFGWQQPSRNLVPYFTAAENIAAALAISGGVRGSARRARVRELLDLLEVSHCADRLPTEMSGGQQQRVAIAVGIANRPRVLLADEPTGELDETTSAHVLEAMRAVNRELGVTTLIVTHDPGVSEHVARTVQIRDGRTSTEVLRSTRRAEPGAAHPTAQDSAVPDRARSEDRR